MAYRGRDPRAVRAIACGIIKYVDGLIPQINRFDPTGLGNVRIKITCVVEKCL